jgi:hypothetical protein
MTRKLQTNGQRRKQMKEMGRSILADLASQMDTCTVKVNAFETKGPKAKVRVSVVANSDATRNDILASINAQFGGKLRAVARSFKIAECSSADVSNVCVQLEGYVVPNVEIVTAASDEGQKMKCVASNMFLDSIDNIWSKTGDFLYKKSDVETAEELNKFLTECSSSHIRQRRAEGFFVVAADCGSFISYMSKGEMCYGFVMASTEDGQQLMVLAEGESDPEVIDTFDVQNKVPIDAEKVNFPEEAEMVETSASSVDINGIVSYYKRWFAYNPQYAAQLIERLKQHAFV